MPLLSPGWLQWPFNWTWCSCAGYFSWFPGYPGGSYSKKSACNARDQGLIPGLGRFLWRRKRQHTPAFLPGESYGKRSLVGSSPCSCIELDTADWITLRHIGLSLPITSQNLSLLPTVVAKLLFLYVYCSTSQQYFNSIGQWRNLHIVLNYHSAVDSVSC